MLTYFKTMLLNNINHDRSLLDKGRVSHGISFFSPTCLSGVETGQRLQSHGPKRGDFWTKPYSLKFKCNVNLH